MQCISRPGLVLALAVAFILPAGCKDDNPVVPGTEFSLQDVNPTSPRYDEYVSPGDYMGQVSAWYFGHAT